MLKKLNRYDLFVGMLIAAGGLLFSVFPPKVAHAEPGRPQVYSKVIDVASLADGAGATSTIAAPNAILGDACDVSAGVDLSGMVATCYISANGTASIRVQNESTATVDLASTTWRVFIIPRGTR